MSIPGQKRTSGGFVAGNTRAEVAELRRILALPPAERTKALEERARGRAERAADSARREIDELLAQ